MTSWNPRYRAYANCYGKTPDKMIEQDTEVWPGGKMAGFILWLAAQRSRWFMVRRRRPPVGPAHSRYPLDALTEREQNDFTAWLLEQHPAPKETQ